jgi:hypothetical protein
VPSVSRAQQRLMQAAEHGADFPMAKKIRRSMTHQQMHDFAAGSEHGKPQHVAKGHVVGGSKNPMLQQAHERMEGRQTERSEHRTGKEVREGPHPHRNLGHFLHPMRRGRS